MKKKTNVFEDGAVTYGNVDNNSIYSLINAIRSGVSFTNFNKLFNSFPFSQADWSWFLGMSERTMLRYRKEKKTFDKLQSEKILNIYLLYNRGEEIFGNKENFNTWLTTANIALGGEIPKKMLDNNFGIAFINDTLTRIEQGISA
jgi:putative toxin-antitoxin system antitoxin component (TIGR02293 family)